MCLQVETEATAQYVVDDLAHEHDEQRRDQQEPAQRQQHEGHLVQRVVAVGRQRRVDELYVVDRVVVAQRRTEIVDILLAKGLVQVVSHSVPHHPPGHSDQPQYDQDHRHDVIHQVAPELAETSITSSQKAFLTQWQHLLMAMRTMRMIEIPTPPVMRYQGRLGSAGQLGFSPPGSWALMAPTTIMRMRIGKPGM